MDITDAQISSASSLITTFCVLLPELYGQDSSTANTHFLTHLPRYVRLWGPLWTHSAFGFESVNGHLRSNIHSQTQVHKQLVFSVEVKQALQRLHAHLAENVEEKHLSTYHAVAIHYHACKTMCSIAPHTYIVGRKVSASFPKLSSLLSLVKL